MKFKNNKGITLISISAYIVIMLVIIALIAVFKNNINTTIDEMDQYTSAVPQINLMHMYMLNETNTKHNGIVKKSADGNYIEFGSGNYYFFDKGKVYKNETKIMDIPGCKFDVIQEGTKSYIEVHLYLEENTNNIEAQKHFKYNLDMSSGIQTATIDFSDDETVPGDFAITSLDIISDGFTINRTDSIDNESGISRYDVLLLNDDDSIKIDWMSIKNDDSKVFTGLEGNTTYKVQMRAVDRGGNIKESNILSVTTGTVPAGTGNITITANPTSATKQNVSVTLTTTTGLKLQYKLGAGAWTNYTKAVEITDNTTVSARLLDSTNQPGLSATKKINNIDKIVPTADFTTTNTTNSITVNITSNDTGSDGTAVGNIGIAKREVSKDNGVTWVNATSASSHTFSSLAQNTAYSIKLRVTDKAGNVTTTAAKSVTTDADTSENPGGDSCCGYLKSENYAGHHGKHCPYCGCDDQELIRDFGYWDCAKCNSIWLYLI